MPLVEQLKQFSEPGNPYGVCLVNSALTAHVLMSGPDSLVGKATVTLPLGNGEREIDLDKTKLMQEGPGDSLDVTKLGGKANIWVAEPGHKAAENGAAMINWLSDAETAVGVYVATVGEEDDEHKFNMVKAEDGSLYLLDSSEQNFISLRDARDVGMKVDSGVEKVPFAKLYCDKIMSLDHCGGLHPDCSEALKAEVKRTVAQDMSLTNSQGPVQKTAMKVT